MADAIYIALTFVLFGALALLARAADRWSQ